MIVKFQIKKTNALFFIKLFSQLEKYIKNNYVDCTSKKTVIL